MTVHCCVYKNQPLVPCREPVNPLHAVPHCFPSRYVSVSPSCPRLSLASGLRLSDLHHNPVTRQEVTVSHINRWMMYRGRVIRGVGNGKEPFGESSWGLTCRGDVAAWCWEGALWGGGCWTVLCCAGAGGCMLCAPIII